MSLNRYEQTLFDYWERAPEERRHWQTKTMDAVKARPQPGEAARSLERELWDYFVERSGHVRALRDINAGGLRRVSLQNLAELMLRLWGPPPKPKRPGNPAGDARGPA
ncbi:MAG: hypothetical protein C0502_03935 [Opitutus sp.]|nr:hypothetical protein [Opitutus sp.]